MLHIAKYAYRTHKFTYLDLNLEDVIVLVSGATLVVTSEICESTSGFKT